MPIAKSIDEAMDLLKGSQPDAQDPQDVKLEKAQDVPMAKAQESEEIMTDMVKSDDFMLGLAKNQDANTEMLVKGLQSNMDASLTILKSLQSMGETISAIDTRLKAVEGTPAPAKGALHKGEADALKKAVATSPVEETPASENEQELNLEKSEVVRLLSEGAMESRCEALDVVKAESGFGGSNSMGGVDMVTVLRSLSPGGKKIIKTHLDARNQA